MTVFIEQLNDAQLELLVAHFDPSAVLLDIKRGGHSDIALLVKAPCDDEGNLVTEYYVIRDYGVETPYMELGEEAKCQDRHRQFMYKLFGVFYLEYYMFGE